MQAEGIIAGTISPDILEKGHQTIRFAADGFSVIISDASFRPVHLESFTTTSLPASAQASECLRVLEEMGLPDFSGESSILLDTDAAAIIPSALFDETSTAYLLSKIRPLNAEDSTDSRYVRSRELHVIQAIPQAILEMKDKMKGEVQILHVLECMLSLADQIKASDHQRGFLLAEVQQHSLSLLAIKEDRAILLNRFALNEPGDFIYHILNAMRQLGMEREGIPVYLSGIVHEEHELHGLLRKYIRNVRLTPYYLETLSRKDISRFMLLSEASKCV